MSDQAVRLFRFRMSVPPFRGARHRPGSGEAATTRGPAYERWPRHGGAGHRRDPQPPRRPAPALSTAYALAPAVVGTQPLAEVVGTVAYVQ